MITIDSITVEGFRGIIKPITYKFNSPGINVITGPNGAGKSTIVTDALAWVVWKKLVKKGKTSFIPWPTLMNEDYKGTMVQLNWHDDTHSYSIVRCNEYKGNVLAGLKGNNKLIIFMDGEEVKEARDKKDQQQWIQKYLGYSFDLFKSTVLFAQELDRLMEEDGPSKKMIFDEAFDSVFIGRARVLAEMRYQDCITNQNKCGEDKEKLLIKIKGLNAQIKLVEESVKNFQTAKKARVNKKLTGISQLKTELEKAVKETIKHRIGIKKYRKIDELIKIEKKSKTKDAHDREFKAYMNKEGENSKLQELNNKLKGLIKKFGDRNPKCKECGRPLKNKDKKFREKKLRLEITDIKKEIGLQTTKAKAADNEYQKVDKIIKANAVIDEKIKMLETRLERVFPSIGKYRVSGTIEVLKKTQLDVANKDLKEIEAERPPKNNLKELVETRGKLREERIRVKQLYRTYRKSANIHKWLLDDPLSNSGLKAFIFDSMLKGVNNHLKAYTDLVKFRIKVFIDMAAAAKPISVSVTRDNTEVPYEDLSKGQKQLVHVAIAFALNDVVNDAKPINIMILDELFESLDPDNVEAVWNIILTKIKNKSIHIITHQTQFQPTGAKRTHIIQNQLGQSVIEKA